MALIYYFILAFISGLITKIADQIEDEKALRKYNFLSIPLAIIYGFLTGYLISKAPFGLIGIAVLVAVFIMRKIDTPAHLLGMSVAILTTYILGPPEFEPTIFLIFLVFASMDEWDDFIFFDKPKIVQEFRPLLEISAVIVGLLFGDWVYLAGILSFDAGYVSIHLVSGMLTT